MKYLDKAKITYNYNIIVGTLLLVLILINRWFIKCHELSYFLFGFVIAQLFRVILDFIMVDIESKRLRKELDNMYKDDETYQRLFKKH